MHLEIKTDDANERQIYSEILTETIKGFNRLTLQSTINDYADDNSNKNIAEIYLQKRSIGVVPALDGTILPSGH